MWKQKLAQAGQKEITRNKTTLQISAWTGKVPGTGKIYRPQEQVDVNSETDKRNIKLLGAKGWSHQKTRNQ